MAKKEKRVVGSEGAAGVVSVVVQTSAPTRGAGVMIRVPFRPLEKGAYVCRHITTRLSKQMADNLKAVFTGLHEAGATLSNGRHVDLPAHAVCWLLEHVCVSGSSATIEASSSPCEPGGHMARFIDVRLTRLAAEQLKGIFTGLYEEHQRLSNGRHIDTLAHAVCWLLENFNKAESVDRS